jgi:hypothetical protein
MEEHRVLEIVLVHMLMEGKGGGEEAYLFAQQALFA